MVEAQRAGIAATAGAAHGLGEVLPVGGIGVAAALFHDGAGQRGHHDSFFRLQAARQAAQLAPHPDRRPLQWLELTQAPERGPGPHPAGALGGGGLCFQVALFADPVAVDVLGDVLDDVAHGAAFLLVHHLPVETGGDVAIGLLAVGVTPAHQVILVIG
ncbi:hypothetical protein D3C72_1445740 [compost metagenome]